MNKQRHVRIILFAAAGLCVGIFFASVALGSVSLPFFKLLQALAEGPFEVVSTAGRIVWYVRLPRTLACMLAGAALAVSGVIVQNVLSNRLASPSIIGVNAGAGLAVTICCALGWFSGWLIAGFSFLGALLAVLLVAISAQQIRASRTTVILGGVAVNSCLNAASEAIAILIPEAGMQAADFRVGGFSSVAFPRLLPAAILIVLGLLLVISLTNELEIIGLGEETAQGLGMSVGKMRTLFLALAALLAGASVSFAGLLGFVGLIVPHIGRRLVCGEASKLLPFCILSGAAFVCGCDLLARTLFSPFEIPVGILISFLGGPFFLFLLLRRKGGFGS